MIKRRRNNGKKSLAFKIWLCNNRVERIKREEKKVYGVSEDAAALESQKRALKKQRNDLEAKVSRLKKENNEDEKLKEEYRKMKEKLEQVEDDLNSAASHVIQGYESFISHNSGEFVNSRKAKMVGIHTQIKTSKAQATLLKTASGVKIVTLQTAIEQREKDISDANKKLEAIERKLRRINSALSTM